jgi:hypothetical protein
MRSIFDEEETERLHRQIEIMQLRWAAEQVEMASMAGHHLGDLDALMGSLKQQGMEFTNEENIRKAFASSSNVAISGSSSSSSGSNAVNKANTAMISSGAVHVYQEQPVAFSFPSIGNVALRITRQCNQRWTSPGRRTSTQITSTRSSRSLLMP